VTGSAPQQAARTLRARWAITAVFFVVGLLLSAWFTQIPQLKSALRLSDGELGVALLFPAVGALLSMQVTGRLTRRFGSRPVVGAGCLALAATMPVIGNAGGLISLIVALFLFGLADGMLDVAMNSHAVAVEREMGRTVLQSMHAAFSLGTILGALSGAASIALEVTPLGYLSGAAVGAAAAGLAASGQLLPVQADRDAGVTGETGSRSRTAGWTRFVVVLGLLGAGCLMAEGAAESWSGVFLRDQRHAAAAIATLGYLLFTLVQFGGRLTGDRLHRRWGPVSLVRRGAVVAASGLLLELTGPGPYWAMTGIAVYSLGLSVLVPIVFGAVGHGSADKHGDATMADAVARFTTLSYLGYLLGPAAIGWLAQAAGLSWALASVFLVLAGVIAVSRWTASALPGAKDGAPGGESAAAAVQAGLLGETSAG
jgi:MFS family permease